MDIAAEEITSEPGKTNDTALRLRTREYARQQRKELRISTTDALRFGLGQIKDKISELENLEVKDVKGMASRIKRRKHATAEDLYRLSHAFLQCSENISAFAEVQGATQVLIKELTGGQVKRQIEAAECLCNYSLGDAHVCEKITNMAGSYLVTLLDSHEPRMKRSCLWTLANILATCRKSALILLQMQLPTKLWKLYTSAMSNSHSYHEDAAICLYLIATHAASGICVNDRRYIAENLQRKQPGESASGYFMYIVFQFEIVNRETDLCASHFQHLLNFFEAQLNYGFNKMHIAYGVRVVANIFAARPTHGQLVLQAERLVNVMNKLFELKDATLTMDLVQLLKNLMETQLIDNELLLDRIRVYAQIY